MTNDYGESPLRAAFRVWQFAEVAKVLRNAHVALPCGDERERLLEALEAEQAVPDVPTVVAGE